MDDLLAQALIEIDVLKERIRELEDALAPAIDVPVEYGLTATEMRIFAHLVARPLATKRSLQLAAYGHWIDEMPAENIVESHISKMRHKIKRFGFTVECERFAGYRLDGPVGQFRSGHGHAH
jgi:two-component system cell cycle response regulator CtrA